MKKITLFIGLNDKDTKAQKFTFDAAAVILGDYIAQNIGFGTLSKAAGVYTHDDGETVQEVTIRAEFYADDVNEYAEDLVKDWDLHDKGQDRKGQEAA